MLHGQFSNWVTYCITTVHSFCKYQTTNKRKKTPQTQMVSSIPSVFSASIWEEKGDFLWISTFVLKSISKDSSRLIFHSSGREQWFLCTQSLCNKTIFKVIFLLYWKLKLYSAFEVSDMQTLNTLRTTYSQRWKTKNIALLPL